MISERYYYLALNGPATVPSRDESAALRRRGVAPVFHLDANVCFDLMQIGDGRATLQEKPKALQLLIDAEVSGIDIAPAFGLVELALDKGSFEINIEKYKERAEAVGRALDASLSTPGVPIAVRRQPVTTGFTSDSAKAFLPIYTVLYGHLLKVHALTQEKWDKGNAVERFRDLALWSANDLGCVSVLALQVGAAILGGASWFNPFLSVAKPSADPVRATRAAAWDLLHVFFMQHASTSMTGSMLQHVIFATAEQRLFDIASMPRVHALLRNTSIGDISMGAFAVSFPYFEGRVSELQDTEREMQRIQHARLAGAPSNDVDQIRRVVLELEAEVESAARRATSTPPAV